MASFRPLFHISHAIAPVFYTEFQKEAFGHGPNTVAAKTSRLKFYVGSLIRRTSGELQEVLRTTFKPIKTFLKEVLELLLGVLKMLLDVLDLSWMSLICPEGTRMVRMATTLPS